MKLIWLTDIHLNFLDAEERVLFYRSVAEKDCDAVLISGDIAEAPSITVILKEIAAHLKKPICFVLGNHDYYRGQIDVVKAEMVSITKTEDHLNWLPESGPVLLEKDILLLGEDGWADGRYGDYANSPVVLNDSGMIADLFRESTKGKYKLLEKMQQLADDDAKKLYADLTDAIKKHQPKNIIVLTHVPPFKEASMYEGKMSGDDFLPFFSSKATGDVLLKIAKENIDRDFLVLCGHTHHEAHYQASDNLTVRVGGAEYSQPKIEEVVIS